MLSVIIICFAAKERPLDCPLLNFATLFQALF